MDTIGLHFSEQLQNEGTLGNAIDNEMAFLIAGLHNWSDLEHNGDGSHSAITATSVDVMGDVTIGGDVDAVGHGVFGGTVTAGGATDGAGNVIDTVVIGRLNANSGGTFELAGAIDLGDWRMQSGTRVAGATVPPELWWQSTIAGGRVLRLSPASATAFTLVAGANAALTQYDLTLGTTGSGRWTNAYLDATDVTTANIDKLALRSRLAPAQITANVNNYAINTASRIFLTANAAWDITGIVAGIDGQVLWIVNNSGFALTLKNNNAGSSAGNKILGANAADVVLRANNGNAMLQYDSTTGFWFVHGA